MDSKCIKSLFKVYSFIHAIKLSLPDLTCQDCNTVRTKGKYNLILMVGPRLRSNLQRDPGSSISQAMEDWPENLVLSIPLLLSLRFVLGWVQTVQHWCVWRGDYLQKVGRWKGTGWRISPDGESSSSGETIVFTSSEISTKSFPISGIIGGLSIEKNQLYIVYLDFSKAFGAASQSIPLEKLSAHGLDRCTLLCVENWLDDWAQSMVMNGVKSSWSQWCFPRLRVAASPA